MAEPQSIHPRYALSDLKRERGPLLVLALTAVVLAVVEYWFLAGSFTRLFPEMTVEYAPGVAAGGWRANMSAPWWGVFLPWAWWVAGMLVLWVALPWGVAHGMGLRPRDLGLGLRGVAGKLWVYGVLLAIVFVGVIWASTQEGFTRIYPMLKPWYCERWTWAVLLGWWLLYGVQFFCVEFFFRGFMLFTLEKRFGMSAVAVMIVPYCMIHFHKPLPEALGAIIAGVVLGWLALRTRSIWGGFLIHVAVALSMDALSLWRGWGFPKEVF